MGLGSTAQCTLFLSLCAALCVGASVVEVIPDPPVQFLDDEKRPKYIIAVDRDGDAVEPPALPGLRTVTMTDKTGKRYTCKMPAVDQQVANTTAEAEQDAKQKQQQQSSPSELLDDLTGLCFYRAEDWWTYEVCYKRHVRQFHREHTQDSSMRIAVEYLLGNFNESGMDTDTVQVDTSPGQKQLKYVSQLYDNGDTCDLTGGKRQTEVRYSCGEGTKDLIVSIKEPSTCHYVMSVRTPRVCPHPRFRVEQVPVSHVLCSAVPAQLDTAQEEGAEEQGATVADADMMSETVAEQPPATTDDHAADTGAAEVSPAEVPPVAADSIAGAGPAADGAGAISQQEAHSATEEQDAGREAAEPAAHDGAEAADSGPAAATQDGNDAAAQHNEL